MARSKLSTAKSGVKLGDGPGLEKFRSSIGPLQHVVVEAVLVVPERIAARPLGVDGRGQVDEIAEEFVRDILIGGSSFGSSIDILSMLRQNMAIQAVPSALLDLAAVGEGKAAVEDADIAETEEAAFEDIVATSDPRDSPPSVAHEELVECAP